MPSFQTRDDPEHWVAKFSFHPACDPSFSRVLLLDTDIDRISSFVMTPVLTSFKQYCLFVAFTNRSKDKSHSTSTSRSEARNCYRQPPRYCQWRFFLESAGDHMWVCTVRVSCKCLTGAHLVDVLPFSKSPLSHAIVIWDSS